MLEWGVGAPRNLTEFVGEHGHTKAKLLEIVETQAFF